MQTAADFYERCFGWTRTADSNENIIFIALNGMRLGLFSLEALAADAGVNLQGPSNSFKGFTLAYNVKSTEEVDQLFTDLALKGVRIIKHPEQVFWGGYSGYIADPDDNLWEIAFNPFINYNEDNTIKG